MNYLICRGLFPMIKLIKHPGAPMNVDLTEDILAGYPEMPCCDVERPRSAQWTRHKCEIHGMIYLFWPGGKVGNTQGSHD